MQQMYELDFEKPVRVHFIGIGGISMSGLARILLDRGFSVSGSDRDESPITKELEEAGIRLYYGQKAENIDESIELIVYTAAISDDNPELVESRRRNIPGLTRAELLGQIMKNYELPIAVSGTHGKTTTTSMITSVLMAGDMDPTISVGGMLDVIGGENIRIGSSGLFVLEACEYTNSFLSFFPKIGLILNIEEDHLDFFKDIDDIRASFHSFAMLIPGDGLLVINSQIKRYEEIIRGVRCRVLTFGSFDTDDYRAGDISYDDHACASFTVLRKKEKDDVPLRIELKVPGEHNISNALAAIAVMDHLGVDGDTVRRGFEIFKGANRRFQLKGRIGDISIIDDYAHHPTEIRATLSAARNYPHNKLWCIFQPHTYSRTKAFFDEFCDALALADAVIFADIYAAREKDDMGISSMDLMKKMKDDGNEAYYFSSFDEIENFVLQNVSHGDLLITMGAGNVDKIGDELLGR